MLTADLATWIAPVSLDEFHRDYWLRKPLVTHPPGPGARLDGIEQLIGPFEVSALLERASGDVTVWYAGDDAFHTDLKVPPATARELYRAGLTLYFDLDPAGVGGGELLAGLCEQLGQTSAAFAIHSIFATRRGKLSPAHIDERENFTVQLTGHKRWRCGYNPLWRLPLAEWSPGMRPGELLPADARTFELTPGSVLYLPGTWAHATEDLGDSLSLNVSVRVQTWADVLIPLLTRYLTVNRGWGEPAGRLIADDGIDEDVVARLHERLGALSQVAVSDLLQFDAGLTDEPGAPVRYRRNPMFQAWLRPSRGGFAIHIEGPNPPTRVWNVPDDQLAIYRWIARAAGPFSFAELRAQFPESSDALVHQSFQRAVDAELVVPVE